jgi:hypothetical protein
LIEVTERTEYAAIGDRGRDASERGIHFVPLDSSTAWARTFKLLRLGALDMGFSLHSESRLKRSPSISSLLLESIFMKFGTYIMTSEPNSKAYFIHPSHQSVSMCIPYSCEATVQYNVSLYSLLGNGSIIAFP